MSTTNKKRPKVLEDITKWKFYVPLAQVVRIYMDEQEWTQKELSEQTGLSYPLINFIVTGQKTNLTYETIAKLCHAFGINPAQMLMPRNAYKQMLKLAAIEDKDAAKKGRGRKQSPSKNVPRNDDIEEVSLKNLRKMLKKGT